MAWVDTAKERADLMEAQKAYGERIVSWLHLHFPELESHPAAIAAVTRLHHRYGKGSLTKSEHGPEIRAAVRDFNERFYE